MTDQANDKDEELLTEELAIQKSETWLEQKIFNEVSQDIYQRGAFTVCIINASAENKLYEGVGFSKLLDGSNVSMYDSDRGKKIALGRAIQNLFNEYRKDNHIKRKRIWLEKEKRWKVFN